MYSRSYYQDEEMPTPPANYDGTAFSNGEEQLEIDESVSAEVNFQTPKSSGSLFGLSGLFDFFDKDKFSLSKIGTEELLILASSAYWNFQNGG